MRGRSTKMCKSLGWRGLVGVLVLVAAFLSGCGNMAFKRGASPEQISADEKACRAATDNDEKYVECMRARGYWMPDADSVPLEAETDSSTMR